MKNGILDWLLMIIVNMNNPMREREIKERNERIKVNEIIEKWIIKERRKTKNEEKGKEEWKRWMNERMIDFSFVVSLKDDNDSIWNLNK